VALVLLAAVAGAILSVGNPFPPRTVVMVTGPEGSAFRQFGVKYREALKREGVDLQLIATAGGAENLARLNDPNSGVAIGFVEGGLAGDAESDDLASLGTVAEEPLWIFLRTVEPGTAAARLRGKRIAVDPLGSGGQVMVRRLLAINGVDTGSVSLIGLSPEQSADALLRGEVDVAMMLTSWESPAVQRLLLAEGITLEGYPRADAYIARSRYLFKVVLPTGVADLAKNIPATDVQLLAIEASLVVRRDLHPALQYMLLQAAADIHGGPGVFHRAGRFSAGESIDLPLSAQAEVYYKSGRPFLYSYFPFWLAGPVERLAIVLIPLFAVVFPIAHFVPQIYAYMLERRIFRYYGELKALELELEALRPGESTAQIVAELEDLGARASRIKVPIRYQQRLHILMGHIALARERVDAQGNDAQGPLTLSS
jgi:TRAP-type uncharacterized transport system substrate-binding protein